MQIQYCILKKYSWRKTMSVVKHVEQNHTSVQLLSLLNKDIQPASHRFGVMALCSTVPHHIHYSTLHFRPRPTVHADYHLFMEF